MTSIRPSAARRVDISAHTKYYGSGGRRGSGGGAARGAARPDPRAVVWMYERLQIKYPR